MTNQDRFHSLDAVRGFALLLGIVLHAAMSFFMPIPRMDNSPSTTLSVFYFVVHIFRMPVFFLIAGFFAHMVFHRKGWGTFIKDRARRIGFPLIICFVTLIPTTVAAYIWGATGSSWLKACLSILKGQFHGSINWAHLWFLYYLCIFYIVSFVLYWIFDRFIDRNGRLRILIDKLLSISVRSYGAPFLLAVPVFLCLYFSDNWFLWMGIEAPGTTIIPQLAPMIGFGTAFGFGWFLHRQTALLAEWKNRWGLNLGIALALTIFCLYLVGLKPDFMAMFTGKNLEGWRRFGYAAAYTTAAWFWIFGILGAALRFCSGFSARRRYLADASYWLYLMHLPVIVYLQVVMANLPLHWSFKFTAILAVTTALGLISYHFLVRSTFIGSILNGRRYPGMHVGAGTTAGRTSSGVIDSGLPLYKGAENIPLQGIPINK